MLAIARMSDTGEIFWCSPNWPYVTGFSFLKTIGSKMQELLPGYRLDPQATDQNLAVQGRRLCLHTFRLDDSFLLVIDDRTDGSGAGAAAPPTSSPRPGKRAGAEQGAQDPPTWEQRVLFAELPSQAMQELYGYALKAAATDANVLILGETGVGKEGIAQFVHQMSRRSGKPFVKLNCGAIPETLMETELFGYAPGAYTGAERSGRKGVFEEADGGTLFLDEVGELPPASQAKLLHVLQDRRFKKIGDTKTVTVDVRIIAATNRDLEQEVAQGRFREDLYYRLCVLPIQVPPLRKRPEDIEPLVRFFLEKFQHKYQVVRSVSPDVFNALALYSWPGNIRQLENLIERLVVTAEGPEISFFDLPAAIRETLYPASLPVRKQESGDRSAPHSTPIVVRQIVSLKEATTLVEKELLRMAKEVSASTYDIARMLGVDQSTVSRKLKQYAER